MGKKSIVITTIEEKLSPYGFHYVKYQGGRWTFSREVDGVSQNVFIQKGMWGDDYYILEINTSASPGLLRIRNFSKDVRYNSDSLEFHSEEEPQKVLEVMANLIIQYGIDKMNELSLEVKHYKATSEMHKKLFREQETITKNFMERHGVSIFEEEKVLLAIKEEWVLTLQEEYGQIQDKIVELVAVYGNMLIQRIGGKWGVKKANQNTEIEKMPIFVSYPVLKIFVRLWEEKEVDSIIKRYKIDVTIFLEWVDECRQYYGPDWQPPRLEK